ncbi:MAG: hypothetical protein Q4B84_00755 [Clostridia bacterium]|nr:hypothetical protein [Clostridia bacterium]
MNINTKKFLSLFLSVILISQSGALKYENVNATVIQSVASKKVKKISTFKKAIYLTGSVVLVVAGFLGIKKLVSSYSKKNKTKSSSFSNSKTQTPDPAPNKRNLNLDDGCNCGIDNIGSSCYMNAMLQILYDIEEFREFIFRTAEGNGDGINEENFEKIKAMVAVFKHMSGEQSLDINKLKEYIHILGHNYKMDDCNACIFEHWNEIINKFEKTNNIKEGDMFHIVYAGNEKTTFSKLLEKENIDINSCIVGGKFIAFISRVGSNNKKIMTEVKPDEITKDNKIYKLTGVIVHTGESAGSGHYYSYKLNSKNGKWYKYNDNIVSSVEWNNIYEEISKNATSFLYTETQK